MKSKFSVVSPFFASLYLSFLFLFLSFVWFHSFSYVVIHFFNKKNLCVAFCLPILSFKFQMRSDNLWNTHTLKLCIHTCTYAHTNVDDNREKAEINKQTKKTFVYHLSWFFCLILILNWLIGWNSCVLIGFPLTNYVMTSRAHTYTPLDDELSRFHFDCCVFVVLLCREALSMCVHAYVCKWEKNELVHTLFWYIADTVFSDNHSHGERERDIEGENLMMNGTIIKFDILFVYFIWITPEIKHTHTQILKISDKAANEWASERTNERQHKRQTIDGRHPMSNTVFFFVCVQNNNNINNCNGNEHKKHTQALWKIVEWIFLTVFETAFGVFFSFNWFACPLPRQFLLLLLFAAALIIIQ